MSRLAWSPSAAITPTWAGTVVRSDLASFHLRGADAGAFVESVAPLLDGTRDLAAVQAALDAYSAGSVAALIGQLVARGLVEEVDGAGDRSRHPQRAVLRSFSADPTALSERLARARVHLAGRAPWMEAAMIALREAGVGEAAPFEARSSDGIALLVGGIPASQDKALSRAARWAHRRAVVSLWAELEGSTAYIGPVVSPGQTACRVCAGAEGLGAIPPRRARSRSSPDAVPHQLLGQLVAMEAIKLVTGYAPSRLGGRVLIQDLRTWESSWRTLVRVPWCPVCG